MEQKRRQRRGKNRAGYKTIAFEFLIRPATVRSGRRNNPGLDRYPLRSFAVDLLSKAVPRIKPKRRSLPIAVAFVGRLTPFVAGLNAGIVAQILPLGLMCVAA